MHGPNRRVNVSCLSAAFPPRFIVVCAFCRARASVRPRLFQPTRTLNNFSPIDHPRKTLCGSSRGIVVFAKSRWWADFKRAGRVARAALHLMPLGCDFLVLECTALMSTVLSFPYRRYFVFRDAHVTVLCGRMYLACQGRVGSSIPNGTFG